MRIIGVIDLQDGQAVHARGGQRQTYAAVRHLAGTPVHGRPLELARVYCEMLGLTDIYIADLDAIASAEPQYDIVSAIAGMDASVMVDAGVASRDEAWRIGECGADTIVVGLETLPSIDVLTSICSGTPKPIVFSLDLRAGSPIVRDGAGTAASPEGIAAQAIDAGADAIIVLDVARVGSGAGPDVEMLRRIRRVAPSVPLLAGGGVRGADDLQTLADVGCDGALVATALHDGRLTVADLVAARRLCSPA